MTSVFSDNNGQVYRIYNQSFMEESGNADEFSIRIKNQKSKNNPSNSLINIAFLCSKEDLDLKVFTVCGNFIVW